MVRRGQLILDSAPVGREYGSYSIPPRIHAGTLEEQERDDTIVLRRYVTKHYHGQRVTPDPLSEDNMDL